MAWLDENPPVRSQQRKPRRDAVSGVIVVHTAENTPDYVGGDAGAESVAKFIRGRSDPGSYHVIADSDSRLNLVDFGNEAFHDGTGSNPHSIGISLATSAAKWPTTPQPWRNGAIKQLAVAAADAARHVKARTGIVVPARRISRTQSEARMPGFISHAERDPARRTDPGALFPWQQFLSEYARLVGQEDDDMPTPAELAEAFWNHIIEAPGVMGPARAEQQIGDIFHHARKAAAQTGPTAEQIATAVMAELGDVDIDGQVVEDAVRRVLLNGAAPAPG